MLIKLPKGDVNGRGSQLPMGDPGEKVPNALRVIQGVEDSYLTNGDSTGNSVPYLQWVT